MEKAIITVVGYDHVGITGSVCGYLAEANINILDISQTILDGFFNMMMIVDISAAESTFEELSDAMSSVGEKVGVVIKVQHQDIFESMHRI